MAREIMTGGVLKGARKKPLSRGNLFFTFCKKKADKEAYWPETAAR